MEKEIFLDRFRSLMETSKTFGGITIQGFYDIPNDIFLSALDHYLDTGENVLDEYSEIIYLRRDIAEYERDPWAESTRYFSKRKREEIQNVIENYGFWNIHAFLNDSEIETLQHLIDLSKKREEYRQTYVYRRRQACIYTANPKTRARIFKRDGCVCKKCGTTTNLQLDHIIPVSKGGKDEDGNLQVLCASCNSSKNDKTPGV